MFFSGNQILSHWRLTNSEDEYYFGYGMDGYLTPEVVVIQVGQ